MCRNGSYAHGIAVKVVWENGTSPSNGHAHPGLREVELQCQAPDLSEESVSTNSVEWDGRKRLPNWGTKFFFSGL